MQLKCTTDVCTHNIFIVLKPTTSECALPRTIQTLGSHVSHSSVHGNKRRTDHGAKPKLLLCGLSYLIHGHLTAFR